MEYKFKVGDKVKMKYDCSGAFKGRIYSLILCFRNGKHVLKTNTGWGEGFGCTCQDYWILVPKKEIKPFGIVAFMKGGIT